METKLIENIEDMQAVKGEVYELHYHIMSLPLIENWQKGKILTKLQENKWYKVQSFKTDRGSLIVQIVVVENPVPLILIIGGIIAVLSGFFIWASLDKVYQIQESPAGKILSLGALAGAIGLIVMLGVLMFRGR